MSLNEVEEILKTHICWYVKAHIKPQQRNKLVSVPFSCEVPFKACQEHCLFFKFVVK